MNYPVTDNPPIMRDAQECFADAIAAGVLSADPASPLFAGDHMYMFSVVNSATDAYDEFKHILTRRYVRHTR